METKQNFCIYLHKNKVIHGERKVSGGFHWVLIENESMN